jgi:hypothetical protein
MRCLYTGYKPNIIHVKDNIIKYNINNDNSMILSLPEKTYFQSKELSYFLMFSKFQLISEFKILNICDITDLKEEEDTNKKILQYLLSKIDNRE